MTEREVMDFWQDCLSVTVFPSRMTVPSPRHRPLKKEFFVFFLLQWDSLWGVGQGLTVQLSGLEPIVSARMAVCTQTSACVCLLGPGVKGVATMAALVWRFLTVSCMCCLQVL